MSSLALPRLMSLADLAGWLRQPTRRVASMARRRQIPAITLPDGSMVFDEQDVAGWLQDRKTTADAQEGR
jgi:hypothetical protein